MKEKVLITLVACAAAFVAFAEPATNTRGNAAKTAEDENIEGETTSDMCMETIRLKCACAEDVAGMVNNLMGANASASRSNLQRRWELSPGRSFRNGGTVTRKSPQKEQLPLQNAVRAESTTPEPPRRETVKVLADRRTNSLYIRACKDEMSTLKRLISEMDVKHPNVLLKTVVLEVELGGDIHTGKDWFKRVKDKKGQGGDTIADVIQAAKDDARVKVLGTPVLMSRNGAEVVVEATDMVYLFSGYQYSGSTHSGTQVRNYEKRDIGLSFKIYPRANPDGTVSLSLEECLKERGEDQDILSEGAAPCATIKTRKMSFAVDTKSGHTVLTSGLTKEKVVPPKDGTAKRLVRSELLVFLTPYVMEESWDDGVWVF